MLQSVGAADPVESATKTTDLHLALALKAHQEKDRRSGVYAKGACNNPACNVPLENPLQLYCNGECASEHDAIQKRKAH